VLQRTHPNHTDSDLRDVFDQIDSDRDGRVDFADFVVFLDPRHVIRVVNEPPIDAVRSEFWSKVLGIQPEDKLILRSRRDMATAQRRVSHHSYIY